MPITSSRMSSDKWPNARSFHAGLTPHGLVDQAFESMAPVSNEKSFPCSRQPPRIVCSSASSTPLRNFTNCRPSDAGIG